MNIDRAIEEAKEVIRKCAKRESIVHEGVVLKTPHLIRLEKMLEDLVRVRNGK
jgi:hypothetical protein